MAKIEQNLRELFRNNAPEMTEDKFVEIVGNLLTECMANQVNSKHTTGSVPLPDFLYDDGNGCIRSGVWEDSDVSNEWKKWVNQVNSRQADKRLDDVDFYDLMQSYRHTPMTEQDKTVERYEAVKDWIRQNYA